VLLFNALLFGVRQYTKQWKNVGEALIQNFTSPLLANEEAEERTEYVELLGSEEVKKIN
jgi:hypothetical protein